MPVEVKELPADLAELDRVLGDPELMMVLVEHWRQEVLDTGRAVLTDGRPTIAMQTYVRLMVLKARYRWGYRRAPPGGDETSTGPIGVPLGCAGLLAFDRGVGLGSRMGGPSPSYGLLDRVASYFPRINGRD